MKSFELIKNQQKNAHKVIIILSKPCSITLKSAKGDSILRESVYEVTKWNPCTSFCTFFMFLYEPELTPAGRNLIDGRNAAFGYIVEGFEVLEKLDVNDKIISIQVVNGSDRLQKSA